MRVRVTTDAAEAEALRAQGWCPIECSFGATSVVDELRLDHHGALSHLESVAVRAYRDHYGERRTRPWFVIAGNADADASFAAAALAGLLPHPRRDVPAGLGGDAAARVQADLTGLAETIAAWDVDPIGLNVYAHAHGSVMRLWQLVSGRKSDDIGAVAAVVLWRNLTESPQTLLAPLLDAVRQADDAARLVAEQDLADHGEVVDGVLVVAGARGWGFNTWYGRDIPAGPPSDPVGWRHPVVLAQNVGSGGVTVGCPNTAVAVSLFGEGGLGAVYGRLAPSGWGGREAVGGSPRGRTLTRDEVAEAACVLGASIAEHIEK